MRIWIAALMALAIGAPALAQEEAMPREEREGYLEACLIVTQEAPELAGLMRLGTGAVTRGHASVALFDGANNHAINVDCYFTPMSGPPPVLERVTLKSPAGESEIDVGDANALIRAAKAGERA